MSKNINSETNYILENPVKSMIWFLAILSFVIIGITGFWPFFSTIPPMSNVTFGLYNKEFWENFLVEAHGFLLDFIIFGVIVFGFNHLRDIRESKAQKAEVAELAKAKLEKRRTEEVERMLEELSDYADLDLPEINRKKLGHLKRLQRYGIATFDVTQLTLNGCNVKNFTFGDNSRLIGLQLQGGYMTNVTFNQVKMRSSCFNSSRLTACTWNKCDIAKLVIKEVSNAKGSKFIDCIMTGADLRETNLTGAVFSGSSLNDVKFNGAILDRADLRNTHGLDLEQLSQARSLNYIKIGKKELEELEKLKPEMKVTKGMKEAA